MLVSAERIYLILAFFSCALNLSSIPFEQELTSKVNQYLNSQLFENRFNGEVLISSGDTIIVKKKFQSHGTFKSAQDDDDKKYPVGAIAEQFVAAAILQLEAAGQVSLGKSICRYIANCPNKWNDIHVFHLLSHSSGLASLGAFPHCVEHSSPLADSHAIIALLSKEPMTFKPGTRFSESNSDYLLLSILIAKVSRQPIGGYLAQHIFKPLKMTHTYYDFTVSRGAAKAAAKSESCSEGQLPASMTPFSFDEGIYSTIDDLHKWDSALLAGQFLSKKSLDEMFTPYVEGHGFGWKVIKEFDRKAVIQNDEFETNSLSNRMYPDDDTVILVLSITPAFPASTLSHDLGAILFGKHYPPSSKSAAPGALF